MRPFVNDLSLLAALKTGNVGRYERVLPTVTAFGKLIRTTAFRLTLVYLLLFALFAASLLGYFAWNTRRLINEQITANVSSEIGELSDMFARRGLRGLVFTIENRALRPGAHLHLVHQPPAPAGGGNVGP